MANKKKYKKKYKGQYNNTDVKALTAISVLGLTALTLTISNQIYSKSQMINNTSNENVYENKDKVLEEINEQYLREKAMEVSADEMLNDYYRANTRAKSLEVDEIYKDKFLEVTGVIGNIREDSYEDGAYVVMTNQNPAHPYAFAGVQCMFQDEEEVKEMLTLDVGDEITVVGYSLGNQQVCVSLVDCDIKEISR